MSLDGLTSPLLTLFNDQGGLDLGRNARLARGISEAGVDHLLVLGSTGEFPSITPSERAPLLEVVVGSASVRVDVWAGCGAPSTAQAVAYAEEAEGVGVAALLAVPPYYLHPTDGAIDRYFRAIHRAVTVPLLAYNNPPLVGYALSPSLVHRLARDGVLAGVKDSAKSIDSVASFLSGAPEGFVVLPGDPPLASRAIERGARGAVMGVSNVVPKLCVELVAAARKGDEARARELQSTVDALVEVVRAGPIPSSLKFLAAELRGVEVGYRPPYDPLTPEEEAAVRARLEPLRPRLAPFLGA
ncbi:MAG TPA: dihydrodipicolinate synthase family protein [Thermoplasmata archaeon]|nr:dihydrodipicolinate synthase family protein [Thermoplasmata archaeon]